MSNYLDDSHLAELGREYELFVGAYFEIVEKCVVFYSGEALGLKDGGVDLIAIYKDKTYFVQCKNYLPSKIIHENVIAQLHGAASYYTAQLPKSKRPTPLLVYTCELSPEAIRFAETLGVELKKMTYQKKTIDNQVVCYNDSFSTEGFWSPGLHISKENHYLAWAKIMISGVQVHDRLPLEYQAGKPVKKEPVLCATIIAQAAAQKRISVASTQNPENISSPVVLRTDPEQIDPTPATINIGLNQKLPEADQLPTKANQTAIKSEQAMPETNSESTNNIKNSPCNSESSVSPEEKEAVERGFIHYLLFFNSKSNDDTNVFMSLLKSIGIIVAIIIGLSVACIPLVGIPLLISVAAIIIWAKSD